MEILSQLIDGVFIAVEPINLGCVVVGCMVGLFVGAMPGLGAVGGVAILLPMTYVLPPTSAIIFLGAICYGAMHGGAIRSIMLEMPGASAAMATARDGRPLALKGLADRALVAAALAAFVGGTLSVILFTVAAPPLAEIALGFGAPEMLALAVLVFACFIGFGGGDVPKTLFSIFIGLALSAAGVGLVRDGPRPILMDPPGFYQGMSFLTLAIGVYGIGAMLRTVEITPRKLMASHARVSVRRVRDVLATLKGTVKSMLVGSVLGAVAGVLPAVGARRGGHVAYGVAKAVSRERESFGDGNLDGVVAPASAHTAASTGSLLPMLTLGIPGSPTTAILLGGLVIWGLQPGPLLFVERPQFVWGFVASLYGANLVALILSMAFVAAFLWILRLPVTILAPLVFVLSIIGGYVPTRDINDVWLMLVFGVMAYLMRRLDYPLAPAIVAVLLGPLVEVSMRESLMLSQGSVAIFLERPIAGTIAVVALLPLALPLLKLALARVRRRAPDSAG